jgi:hypothetical protein
MSVLAGLRKVVNGTPISKVRLHLERRTLFRPSTTVCGLNLTLGSVTLTLKIRIRITHLLKRQLTGTMSVPNYGFHFMSFRF